MKFKHVVASLSLAMFTAFGAAAGLSMKKEAKAVKADGDTWMMHFSLNSKEIAGYMDADSMWVQTYTEGVGNSKWFQMYPIESGSQYFAVNATFPDSYSFNRIQYKFSQGGAEKWGVSYSIEVNKESYSRMLYSTFGSWSGDLWSFSVNTYSDIFVEYNDVSYVLEEDVANKRFIASNFVSDESDYYTFYYRCSWDFAESTLTESSKEYFTVLSETWCSMKAGTYDIILKNNNNDDGIVQVYKHETESSYVYVVNESSDCYIYTFGAGGQEQFGAFPGTKISDLILADEAAYIGGTLDFQNKTTQLLRVNVEVGYPVADHVILAYKNEYGYVGSKSADMLLVAGSAYWFSNDADYHNDDAGTVLDVLVELREEIEGATDGSVCNISKSVASNLVSKYLALTEDQKETYFDCSSIETKKRDGSAGSEYVDCRTIIEQVAIIAGSPLEGSSLNFGHLDIANNSAIVIVIAVAAVSTLAFTMLLVFKKKKQK